MAELLTLSVLNGLLYGMLLFLMASGLTVIFGMMGVLNLAHASFYMLGAFLGYQVSLYAGFWPGVILAPLLAGLLGAATERYGLRGAHQHGHIAELLFTFGLALVIEEVVQMVWGKIPVDYSPPSSLDVSAFTLFTTPVPVYKLAMFAISVGVFAALLVVLARTRIGLVIQAALTRPGMVGMLGHNLPRLFMGVFGVGTALAALAGALAGPALVTQASMAAQIGPVLFVVIVVGGLGSLTGALIASVFIGVLQTLAISSDASVGALFTAVGVAPSAAGPLADIQHVTVAQVGPLLPYLLMVAVLAIKPSGLFGKRES